MKFSLGGVNFHQQNCPTKMLSKSQFSKEAIFTVLPRLKNVDIWDPLRNCSWHLYLPPEIVYLKEFVQIAGTNL